MANIIVTEANVHIGMKVMRGRDWCRIAYADQDGGAGNPGTVLTDPNRGWVGVRWDNGREASYRVSGAYDLYIYVPQEGAQGKPVRELLTRDRIAPGVKVVLRPVTEFRSGMAKRYLMEEVVYKLTGSTGPSVYLEGFGNSGFDRQNFHIVLEEGKLDTERQRMVDIAREQLQSLEEKRKFETRGYDLYGKSMEKSKTNTHEHRRDTSSNTHNAIKVRRPACSIERGKRRSAAAIRCSGGSSRS